MLVVRIAIFSSARLEILVMYVVSLPTLLKHTNSLFQPHYTKETKNTHCRDILMLKSLPTEGTEPAVKVVT